MRKTTAGLSALALTALALTGCSAGPTFEGVACDRSESAALRMSVDVAGDFGTPQPEVLMPVRTSHVIYDDLVVGDGPEISRDDQNAIMSRVLVNGTTGEPIHSALSVWSPETAAAELPGVDKALECATEGSRIVVALPAEKLPQGMADQLGLGPADSMVAVYDVRYTLLPEAQGRHVFNDARGLPTVVRAEDGRPGVIIPDANAPKKTVTQTLIAGDGELVGSGAPMFEYTAVDWASRRVLSTSWDTTVSLSTDSLPAEVAEAISTATIGSQLLVVVPGEAGDATAFVIDILGVIPAEMTQG